MDDIECRLELEYEDERIADMIARAVQPDNMEYLSLNLSGSAVICDIKGKNPLQLLHTIDDLLMCVTVAEKTIVKTR